MNSKIVNVQFDTKISRMHACQHRKAARITLRVYRGGTHEGYPFYIAEQKCRDCGKHLSERVEG